MLPLATYLRLNPEAMPPEIGIPIPCRVVVIIEAEVSPEWQSLVSDWIVRSGCLYMIAWGPNCSSWDDSVDWANIDAFKYGGIPEDSAIMTTWHADEPLAEVLWYSKNLAFHPAVTLEHTILLHISAQDRAQELLEAYANA